MQILICFRELPYAAPTVAFGGVIAHLMSSSTTLLHVISKEEEREEAEESLKQAQELLGDLEVNSKIRIGDPLSEIIGESSDSEYDIAVVGTHEALRLLESMFGTITDKVAIRTGSSALVVRGDRTEVKHILIPIGGQQKNTAVVEMGAKIASAAGAKVTLLYVTTPVPSMYTGMNEMEETLSELLETDTPVSHHLHWSAQYLADKGVEAELKLQQGVASDEIMREARVGDYDLVVIGAPTEIGRLRKMLVDQVTPHVIERSPCPVLVVR